MKKVIKSRIFLVIICGIIFTSGGAYAAVTYKASDVLYTSSDGTSMTVNDALNKLYEKNTNSQITDVNILTILQTCYSASTGMDQKNNNYIFSDDYDFVKISAKWSVSPPYYSGYVKFRDTTIEFGTTGNYGDEYTFKDVKKNEVVTVYCQSGGWTNTISGSSVSIISMINGVKLIN